MSYPYMPKSTAVWLVENTSLTFKQIGDFCGLHELEVKNLADSENVRVQGLNPILNFQLTKEEIERCEKDEKANLVLNKTIEEKQKIQEKRKHVYVPKLHRKNRLGGILWIIKNYPELSDSSIAKLIHSTKATVLSMRNKTHKQYSQTKIQNPLVLGLVSETMLKKEIDKIVNSQEVSKNE